MAVNFGQFEAHKDDSVRRTVDMLLNAYNNCMQRQMDTANRWTI